MKLSGKEFQTYFELIYTDDFDIPIILCLVYREDKIIWRIIS